jgi:hypothetical protein
MMDTEKLQESVEQCIQASYDVSQGTHNPEHNERVAALFLTTLLKLSQYMEEVELSQKTLKNEVSRVEAEKYIALKSETFDKKLTEAALTNYVAKDPDVLAMKKEAAQAESSLKKWTYMINNLKDGHIFFRALNNKTNKEW